MKIRIQNNAKGERGFYIGKELLFVDKGATSTFDDASTGDVKNAAKVEDARVWKSEDGKDWEEVTEAKDLPKERQFLAIASGPNGEAMRAVDLAEGEWYVGTAIASEKPEGAGGYTWEKIGGTVEREDAVEAHDPEPDPVDTFDASAIVAQNAPEVIATLDDLTPEQVLEVHDAEKAGRNRKGVMEAIEEKLEA